MTLLSPRGCISPGQIIGTTGYEEAAALGTVAGANAALSHFGREPLHIGRDQGYMGVLVDDLITKGTMEPYRMFTSRAEYRLLLRADNADSRLTALGHAAGIVGEARMETLRKKNDAVEAGLSSLRSFQLQNREWHERGFGVKPNGERRSAEQVLSVPNAELREVEAAMADAELQHGWRNGDAPEGPPLPALGRESVEIKVKYAKYLERQVCNLPLPPSFHDLLLRALTTPISSAFRAAGEGGGAHACQRSRQDPR